MKNSKPDFICIGATKAATSWLYARLKELPVFEMPHRKEIGWFDRYTQNTSLYSPLRKEKLIDRLKDRKWFFKASRNTLSALKNDYKTFPFWLKWYFANYDDHWYQSLFSDKKLSGDITPSYAILESKDIANMKAVSPNTKIIYMIRNPIERDWSQFRMMNPPTKDINKIIEYLKIRDVKARSDYKNNLKRYLKFYTPKQILIVFYDAVQEQPKELINCVLNFLESENIDVEKFCKLNMKRNVSRSSRMPSEVKEYLKSYYFNDIQNYSKIFGGYARCWLSKYYDVRNEKTVVPTIRVSDINYIEL